MQEQVCDELPHLKPVKHIVGAQRERLPQSPQSCHHREEVKDEQGYVRDEQPFDRLRKAAVRPRWIDSVARRHLRGSTAVFRIPKPAFMSCYRMASSSRE